MIQYYLDGQATDPPEGIDAIRFVKRRHRTYFGFLYQKMGLVEGIQNLSFRHSDAVRLLRGAHRKAGILAEVPFRIEQNGVGVLYDGYVDFETYVYAERGGQGVVTAMLRDDRRVLDLDAQAATEFSIAPLTSVRLHARQLAGSATLTLDTARATVSVKRKDAAPLLHTIPLRKPDSSASDGQGLPGSLPQSSEPLLGTDGCYTNTTGQAQLLTVTGYVSLSGRSEQNCTVQLELTAGGKQQVIGRQLLTSTVQSIGLIVDQRIDVPAGGAMQLRLRSDDSVTGYSVTYDVVTQLTLSVADTAADSVCMGLLPADLLSRLIARCSPTTVFRSDFFGDGLPARILTTSGANLRGVNLPLTTSLAATFQNLSSLFSLYMGFDQTGVLRIESRASLAVRRRVTHLAGLLSYTERPAIERLYSEVVAGYGASQASSASSALDPNALRRYVGPLTGLRNSLSIQCSWSAAGVAIEEQRRKQFSADAGSAAKTDDRDNALYLIVTTLRAGQYENERLESVSNASGLVDAANAYNLAISPRRNLANWINQLTPCLPLTLEESGTRQAVQFDYNGQRVDEAADLPGIASRPLEVTIETLMPLPDFHRLGDLIVLPDGTEGLLMDASWQRADAGDVATLTIWPDWKP